MSNPFIKCDQCGLCCRFCHTHPDLLELDRGDGVCTHLQYDNSCGIYHSRPDVCNTRVQYKTQYKGILTKKEFRKESEKACNIIREAFSYPPLD